MVIELRVVQFWSEIILVISNRTRAARSFDFEITRMISDQIALHSVQLPLLIGLIMTSDECQRLYVIKYSDFLIRISLFPQSSVRAFLTFVLRIVLFVWNLLFSIFYFMDVLSMNKRINK